MREEPKWKRKGSKKLSLRVLGTRLRLLAEINYEQESMRMLLDSHTHRLLTDDMQHLDVCYALAILAVELRLKEEPQLTAEMRDRGLACQTMSRC